MTRQLTDRPPAVAEAGPVLRRRPKWSGRTPPGFPCFPCPCPPQPGADRGVHLPPADQQCVLLHPGLDAGLGLGHGGGAGQLRHLLQQPGRSQGAGHHRGVHAGHCGGIHGAGPADRAGFELESPRHHLCAIRRVCPVCAQRRGSGPGVAVHFRSGLRGARLGAARPGPAEPAVDQRPAALAGHGDHCVRLEEPGLLRRGVSGRPAVAPRRTLWRLLRWTAPTASAGS